MNLNPDRMRIDSFAALYLVALEAEDFPAQLGLWKLAETDAALQKAFEEVHDDFIEERRQPTAAETQQLAAAVETYLPSAEIVKSVAGPVTVADVADELLRHRTKPLPAVAPEVLESLRRSLEALPTDLALPKFIVWAEARFGNAPAEYWKAFRETAIKVRMRTHSEIDFQLAARRARRTSEDKPS